MDHYLEHGFSLIDEHCDLMFCEALLQMASPTHFDQESRFLIEIALSTRNSPNPLSHL
jgi:hypothetical protein